MHCSFGRQAEDDVARYFFDVKNGHRLIDPSDIDCGDDHEAIKAGVLIAQQIAPDAPPDQRVTSRY
jgi:hypothetical protein